MKRILSTICPSLAAAMLSISCIYPYDPQIEREAEPRLVVEGDILVGDVSRFTVSSTYSLDGSESKKDWDYANAYVECSSGEVIRGVSSQYEQSSVIDVDTRNIGDDRMVRLHLVVGRGSLQNPVERNYYTDWMEIQNDSSIDSLTFSVAPDKSKLSVLVSSHSKAEEGCYRWRYDELYQYYSNYQSDYFFDPLENVYVKRDQKDQIHKCWDWGSSSDIFIYSTESLSSSTIVNHEVYNIYPGDFKISSVLKVTLHQSMMSRDAYLYYKAMKSNSDDVGGLFSPQPGECTGNIRCEENPDEMAIGYVDATKVVSKTLYINNGKINFYKGKTICPEPYNDMGGDGLTYYLQGLIPVMYVDDDESAPYYTWGTYSCTDCRARGGVTVQPEDWNPTR